MLEMTDSGIRRAIIDGRLPAQKISDRVLLIKYKDVISYKKSAAGRPQKMYDYMVWKNDFGSLSVDTTEHGHYASVCLGHFETRQEAEEFCQNYKEEEEE